MRRDLKPSEAHFEQVLLFADEPQIVLLTAFSGSKIVAIAVDREEMEFPFYGAQISSAQFADYLGERFDLRYLLTHAERGRNYFFDLGASEEGIVRLSRAKVVGGDLERYLPDPGLFARAHTEKLSAHSRLAQTEEKFGVDGAWDLSEFSRFYSNVTDLYSFFNSADMFSNDNVSQDKKAKIVRAFVKPFEGGGSYVSLYDSLSQAQSNDNRLRVSGIAYNSPGYVKLRGAEHSFNEIRELLGKFHANLSQITESYNILHNTLKHNKFLRKPVDQFKPPKQLGRLIEIQTRTLATELDVIDYDTMLALSGNNLLVVSKVLLSVYRRAARLNEFFLQGRVSFGEPSSQQ